VGDGGQQRAEIERRAQDDLLARGAGAGNRDWGKRVVEGIQQIERKTGGRASQQERGPLARGEQARYDGHGEAFDVFEDQSGARAHRRGQRRAGADLFVDRGELLAGIDGMFRPGQLARNALKKTKSRAQIADLGGRVHGGELGHQHKIAV
jgi:hypothetical protein